jgi:hypothetical protein
MNELIRIRVSSAVCKTLLLVFLFPFGNEWDFKALKCVLALPFFPEACEVLKTPLLLNEDLIACPSFCRLLFIATLLL